MLVLAVVLLTGIAGGWLLYLNSQLGDIPTFDAGVNRPDSPKRVPGDALNILLVGADNPDADVRQALSGLWQPGRFRTDTIMILHLNADRTAAQLISIPRDSWVSVDGYGKAKINAAFSYGGPPLLVKTVEQVTDLHIDHVVVVGLIGFAGITETIGGVDVYVPATVTNGISGKVWTKGWHHLEGDEALQYVRQRYGLSGGDFDRISRQQNFMRAVLDKTASKGTLLNPLKVTRLVGQLADFVAVDEGLTPARMRQLALECRGLRSGSIRFVTIPTEGFGTSSDGQSYVSVDLTKIRSMFAAVASDDFESWLSSHDIRQLPGRQNVN